MTVRWAGWMCVPGCQLVESVSYQSALTGRSTSERCAIEVKAAESATAIISIATIVCACSGGAKECDTGATPGDCRRDEALIERGANWGRVETLLGLSLTTPVDRIPLLAPPSFVVPLPPPPPISYRPVPAISRCVTCSGSATRVVSQSARPGGSLIDGKRELCPDPNRQSTARPTCDGHHLCAGLHSGDAHRPPTTTTSRPTPDWAAADGGAELRQIRAQKLPVRGPSTVCTWSAQALSTLQLTRSQPPRCIAIVRWPLAQSDGPRLAGEHATPLGLCLLHHRPHADRVHAAI